MTKIYFDFPEYIEKVLRYTYSVLIKYDYNE